jgi:hypothetical protein
MPKALRTLRYSTQMIGATTTQLRAMITSEPWPYGGRCQG